MKLETSARVFPKQSLDDKIARPARVVSVLPTDVYSSQCSSWKSAERASVSIRYGTASAQNAASLSLDIKEFREFQAAYHARIPSNLVGKPVIAVYNEIESLEGLVPFLG